MKLFIESYVPEDGYHKCRDEEGKLRRVDVLVDGGLKTNDGQALVGKTIICDYLYPFIEIAVGVKESGV